MIDKHIINQTKTDKKKILKRNPYDVDRNQYVVIVERSSVHVVYDYCINQVTIIIEIVHARR